MSCGPYLCDRDQVNLLDALAFELDSGIERRLLATHTRPLESWCHSQNLTIYRGLRTHQ